MLFCAKCEAELEDSIPESEWDEDETPDEIGVLISQELERGGRCFKVGGVLCGDCMRRGHKIPMPELEVEIKETPFEKLRKVAEKHSAKTLKAVVDAADDDELDEADSDIRRILGESEPKHAGVIDDVLLTDDLEDY